MKYLKCPYCGRLAKHVKYKYSEELGYFDFDCECGEQFSAPINNPKIIEEKDNIYRQNQPINWKIDLDDKEDIGRVLVNKAYEFALIFEILEHNGIISGNGHHKAQDIARYIQGVFDDSYKEY